jgi:xylulokinase
MACLLGIDVSTTASKAVLLSDRGAVVGVASTPHSISTPRPLWSEQDPEMWWDAVRSSIREVVAAAGPGRAGDIVAIGLTGQMHGLVVLDKRNEVLRPAILWDDQRSAEECGEIRDRITFDELVRLTGNDAYPGFTLPKLLWVRNHEPDTFAKVARVLLPKDYIRYKLSGEFATDKAGAGGTLMLDLARREWSPEITTAFDIPADWLPETFEGTSVTSTLHDDIARETGLPRGLVIVGGGGDQAAQAVGVGAIDAGVVSVSLGTSGVVFAGSSEPLYDPKGAAHAFPHAVPGRWHMMGVMLSAAGSLRWYHDNFAPDIGYDELIAEAETVSPGCDGLYFMPYLSGERTPHADPLVRGAFVGLTHVHRRAHAARAVLEGVAYGLRDNLDLLLRAGVDRPDVIRVSGGGARSGAWLQIVSDVMGVPLVTVESSEGAAVGAAMLAGVGVGVWPDAQSAAQACVRLDAEVEPDQIRIGEYEERIGHFRGLYKVLAPFYRASITKGMERTA